MNAPVTTSTRSFLLGLVGAGVGPSLTPPLHEREAAELGHRLVYRTVDITELGLAPDAVGDLVRSARHLGFDGLNITHPCKQLAVPHMGDLSAEAEALAAVNTVVFDGDRAVGHNTDWSGFARALEHGLPDAARRQVVLLGAGGAGAAVAHALLVAGVEDLAIVDVEPRRAAALAARSGRRFGADRCRSAAPDRLAGLLAGADGLVHATPIGMAAHPGLPLPAELLHPRLWVSDIVYRPIETELLRRAAARGCRTLDGGRMAVFQAADSFRLFTGLAPDPDRMLAHFRELVAWGR